MPTVEHGELVNATPAQIWTFVRDMDQWAPFITGYQRHEKLSETESLWFLKGEFGGLTRVAEFRVLIDEWDESGRVRFSLQGINEPVTGSGRFLVSDAAGDAEVPAVNPPREGLVARVARWLYGLLFGKAAAPRAAVQAGPTTSKIDFELSLNASGAAGMILNVLITPMLRPVAEDLARKIADAVTQRAQAAA